MGSALGGQVSASGPPPSGASSGASTSIWTAVSLRFASGSLTTAWAFPGQDEAGAARRKRRPVRYRNQLCLLYRHGEEAVHAHGRQSLHAGGGGRTRVSCCRTDGG